MSYYSEVIHAGSAMRVDFTNHLVGRILSRVKGEEFPDWMNGIESVFIIRGWYSPKDTRFVISDQLLSNVCSTDIRIAFEAAKQKENAANVQSFFEEANTTIAKLDSLHAVLLPDKTAGINYEAKIIIPIKAGFFNAFVAECKNAKKEAAPSEQA